MSMVSHSVIFREMERTSTTEISRIEDKLLELNLHSHKLEPNENERHEIIRAITNYSDWFIDSLKDGKIIQSTSSID